MTEEPAATGRWFAPLPADTEALAADFSRSLPPALERAWIVTLQGDLGSGKTTWARGLLGARGVDRVRSPTFPLLETYLLPELTVAHLDLYRLGDPGDLEGLGLRDLDAPGHLWLVEWPERGGPRLPVADVVLRFQPEGYGRRLSAQAGSPAGILWLTAAAAAAAARGVTGG